MKPPPSVLRHLLHLPCGTRLPVALQTSGFKTIQYICLVHNCKVKEEQTCLCVFKGRSALHLPGMRRLSYGQLNTVTRGITIPGGGGDIQTLERAFLRQYAGGSVGKSASQPTRDLTSVVHPPAQRTLQQYLGNGEYPLFQSIAMFESSFIQGIISLDDWWSLMENRTVAPSSIAGLSPANFPNQIKRQTRAISVTHTAEVTRKGKQVFIHKPCNQAIVGIATTNPKLPLPNIMFIARPRPDLVSSGQQREELMLTRLIPLKFVRISIHDSEKQLIKIKLINRRSYYLQLYSSTEDVKALFDCWLSLVHLLHHPPRSYLHPYPKSRTTIESLSVQVVPSEIDTKVDHGFLEKEDEDETEEVWEDEMEEVWEDETDSLPLERKATRPKFQSQDTIMGETYTKSEDQIIRLRSRLLTSSRWSLPSGWESFESYQGSLPPTVTSKRFITFSNLLSEESDLTLSRCSLPPTQIPEKGDSSSVNIVTIFSVVSKHADIGGGGKS